MCQEAIRQGWLPHPDITISWDMIKHERYQVFCWYMQQPDLRQQFIDYANENAQELHDIRAPQLKVMKLAGVDMASRTVNGNTWAHIMFANTPTKAVVEWWARHQPEVLREENAIGTTPDEGLRDASLRAWLQQDMLKKGFRGASASKATPKRRL
jgi:hypothetical protein